MAFEFKINRLGHQGDGIADGPVYAPRTLPGEVVSGVLTGTQLSDVKIVSPSDSRVSPPCRHYKACGGCQLQHASDEFVADWKVGLVRSALESHGLEPEFRPLLTSPARSRRRATLAVKRTKKGAMSGFYGRASGVITPIPDCQLLQPGVIAGIPVAEALATQGASRKAALAVTLTQSREGLDVSVAGGKPLTGPLLQTLAQVAQAHHVARLAWDGDVIAMAAPPTQMFGATKVVPPPGGFLQATDAGEAALVAAVCEIAKGATCVADLFAGCGTFSLPLARGAEVLAVEGDGDMVRALDQGWRGATGLKHVTSVARDLFRRPLLVDELQKFDTVVLDPPRAGAAAQVAELARANVARIAYVSCNPVTFARDAKTLTDAGYELGWVQVVDQFRWSVHTELVASFARSNAKK
ncbi:MAG: RsmD family RNA methyltransferase [Rhodobacteraceae bacterium]|nr:RsmD family RNA methyltransferase [Paracoccaceae bacterium]